MDGATMKAGRSRIKHIKNRFGSAPLMEKSPHVMMAGRRGAFAEAGGCRLRRSEILLHDRAWKALQDELAAEKRRRPARIITAR